MNHLLRCLSLALLATTAHATQPCVTHGVAYNAVANHAVSYAAPAAVAAPTNVYVVNNAAHPAPLVAQGNTLYSASSSYQAATLPFLDPNNYFQQELQLQRDAASASAQRSERTAALVERIVGLQAPAAQTLAKGQAAQAVLHAAGLTLPTAPGHMQGVVVTRDAHGAVRVVPLTPEQAAQAATTTPEPEVAANNAPGGVYPLTTQFCGKCHGTAKTNPGGGFYLGTGAGITPVMRAEWFKITKRISDGTMPPASSPQPTDQQRAKILDELERMILEGDQK